MVVTPLTSGQAREGPMVRVREGEVESGEEATMERVWGDLGVRGMVSVPRRWNAVTLEREIRVVDMLFGRSMLSRAENELRG
jgi:hypothetical protein